MIKKFFLSVAIVIDCTHMTAAAKNDVFINVDGADIVCSNATYILNDYTMIYYKDIADILGVYIDWDKSRDLIKVGRFNADSGSSPVIEYTMPVNKPYVILFDGSYIKIDVPAVVANGRLYVPLRAVSEQLNAEVEWKADRGCVDIKTVGTRTLLNGRFNIVLPVYITVYDVRNWLVLDDGSSN